MSYGIPFTQYLRPDGRAKEVVLHHEENVEAAARELIASGLRFEAEVLVSGEVSLTVTDGEEDIAIELVPNGPAVSDAVVRLVQSALEWRDGPERMAR